MTYVRFVLVAEGSFDEALVDHLERLFIWVGAREVSGVAVDFARLDQAVSRDVASRLKAALALEPGANVFLVHRDADAPDPEPRHAEIRGAVEEIEGEADLQFEWIGVVPVQETEAWLLLNEGAIRTAAGNPNGRVALALPAAGRVEQLAAPKERLHELLLRASETAGRRRERFKRRVPGICRQLLRRLPLGGALENVPAWCRLRNEMRDTIQYI